MISFIVVLLRGLGVKEIDTREERLQIHSTEDDDADSRTDSNTVETNNVNYAYSTLDHGATGHNDGDFTVDNGDSKDLEEADVSI
jgi:hypothetical protein